MDSILATTTGLTHNEDLSEYESQLDLFNKVGTDTNIISSRYMELEPQSVVTDESKQFIFNSSSQDTPEYTDLSQVLVYAQCTITKYNTRTQKSSPVTKEDNVALCANAPDTLFSNVDIYINNTLVSNKLEYRNIYAQLIKTLNFGQEARKSFLQSELGDADYGDDTTDPRHANIVKKFATNVPSAPYVPVIDLISVLTHQLGSNYRLFPNKLSFKFVLNKAEDSQLLLTGMSEEGSGYKLPSNTEYRVNIKNLSLFLKRVTLKDDLMLKVQKSLDAGKLLKYYWYRPVSRFIPIRQGTTRFMSEPLFDASTKLSKIILMFFTPDRLRGNVTKSMQYYYRPRNLESVSLYIDGRPVHTLNSFHAHRNPFTEDFFHYTRLFTSMESYYTNDVNGAFSFNAFTAEKYLLCYSLSVSGISARDCFPLLQNGELKVSVEFSPDCPEELIMVAFGESPSLMNIDRDRNIMLTQKE